MSSIEGLKIINGNCSKLLEELLVNCQNVKFFSDSLNTLILVGYWENKLCIIPALTPTTSQLLSFNEDVIFSCCLPNRIYILLSNYKIALITNGKGKWKAGKEYSFNLQEKSILSFLPLDQDLILCLKDEQSLEISYSCAGQDLSNFAYIDCLKEPQAAILCLLPPFSTVLLIGTDEDGHVYQLSLNKKHLQLICDIHQPVASIVILSENQIAVIGRHGKIVLLSHSGQVILTTFAPTTTINQCSSFESFLYISGDDQQFLYSTEVKSSDNVIQAKYCKVTFVRSFYIDSNRKVVIILTEDGVIYESSLHFEAKHSFKSGSDMKSILCDIQESGKRMKELNMTSENIRKDLDQLSMALQMIEEDQSTKFSTVLRSFPSLDSERLRIYITNNSSQGYSASHWSLQIDVNQSSTSSSLKEIWENGATLELEHVFQPSSNFDVSVRITLVFRANDPLRKPVCVFPLTETKLSLLDFLEQAPSSITSNNKIYDVIGFSRKLIDAPWPFLLSQSWHRGFQQLLTDPTASEVSLRCGKIPLKLSLKESDLIWILRIDTMDRNLLKNIRQKLYHLLIPVRDSCSTEFFCVPSRVIAQLQNLRSRLNYIQSLENWDETDTEPLRDEMRLLMAKEFHIR